LQRPGSAQEVADDDDWWAAAGSTRAYLCPERDQVFLMAVSMRDWLEEGHLA
jgi:hypothetical protein